MFENHEQYKVLALSTVHIRPSTAEWLCHQAGLVMFNPEQSEVTVYKTSGGFMLTCTEEAQDDSVVNDPDFPKELKFILLSAALDGYGMVWLDGDADECDRLPKFRDEWDAELM